jgi:hypothetical protein
MDVIMANGTNVGRRPDYFHTPEEDRPVTSLQTPDEHAKSASQKDTDKSLVSDLKKLTTKSSMNSLNAKSSVAEPSERMMTVETETVSSIPQQTTSLAPGSERSTSHHRGVDANGSSLKVKRSTETIRPRKERKRAAKKPSSANVASCTSPICRGSPTSPRHFSISVSLSSTLANMSMYYSAHRPVDHVLSSSVDSAASHRPCHHRSFVRGEGGPARKTSASSFASLALRYVYPSANVHLSKASSRADIFEESVQNAMEEATSDDSDETFVYESNPPETSPRKGRHHSRTPSGTSIGSGSGDGRGIVRSIAKALDLQRPVPKTRSMKFASSSSNYVTPDEDGEVRDGGTIRASQRNGSSIHHHLGRPSNRNMTNGPSILDEDNPLFPVGKTRSINAGGMPRAAILAAQQLRNPSMKTNGYTLDMDDQTADDEQTPLLTGTVRTRGSRFGRQSRGRRSGQQSVPSGPNGPRPRLAKFVGCILILTTVSVLAFGVVCFLFAMSKPLNTVSVIGLKSVIATEQELMFDITIEAVNPNLVPITITDLDVNLFAKSKYVGSDKWWREHGRRPPPLTTRNLGREARKRGIINTDPILISDPPPFPPNDPSNAPTMLLGQILHFDSPLSFDGSFWSRSVQTSTGSLRLSSPGNRTENGGGKRWETVLEHDFQLIVRGVLHYNIPLGGSANRVPICGYTFVKGSTDEDDGGDDDDGDGDDVLLLEASDPFPGDSPCEV